MSLGHVRIGPAEELDEALILLFEISLGIGQRLFGIIHQFWFKHARHHVNNTQEHMADGKWRKEGVNGEWLMVN